MSENQIALHWKLTALAKPKDEQVCLIFNPCDGYRVAEYCAEDECFYQDVPFEAISNYLAVYWMELPNQAELSRLSRSAAFQVVKVQQAVGA